MADVRRADGPEIALRRPCLELVDNFVTMVNESLAAGEDAYRRLFLVLGLSLDDPLGLVRRLEEFSRGERLPRGLVASTTWWLVRDGVRVLGESRLRHSLTPGLEHEGGHIGYIIRPAERQRGYGTRILALTLEQARERGLSRVLVTCNSDNVASARIIRKNGGQFDSEVISQSSGQPVSRYWIELSR